MGKELEVDAICDGEHILIPGIMEHLERAGIHSGDSISVYPTQSIAQDIKDLMVETTGKLARALQVVGLMNVQYVLFENQLYVIEVNPRSSRTVPYISKVTGIPMVNMATQIMMGKKLADFPYGTGIAPEVEFSTIKVPVFSFEKLRDVDISLGPEMKSTGEVLGIGKTFPEAFLKGIIAAGIRLPKKGSGILMTVRDTDKEELVLLANEFQRMGFSIWATEKTARALETNGIKVSTVAKIGEGSPNLLDIIEEGRISMVINTPTRGKKPERDGFKIRRKAIEMAIPCLTALDTARGLASILALEMDEHLLDVVRLDQYSQL
jgi:carbamoyl-phosphate synthase large subunit